jgi:hypothetical protein
MGNSSGSAELITRAPDYAKRLLLLGANGLDVSMLCTAQKI